MNSDLVMLNYEKVWIGFEINEIETKQFHLHDIKSY